MKKISLLILLISSLVYAEEQVANSDTDALSDPTVSIDKMPYPTLPIAKAGPIPVLKAIAKNKFAAFCVINDHVLGRNDEFDGFIVSEIKDDYVVLVDANNNKLKLKLY
jgi:hypothetical protein